MCIRDRLGGQAFHWELQPEKNYYIGVVRNYIIGLRETAENFIEYAAIPDDEEVKDMLHDYLQLSYDYDALCREWAKDEHFKKIASKIVGLRIIRQDPFECLISFICSQNNNIIRNTKMLGTLRKTYGKHLGSCENKDWYSFPTLEEFSKISEQDLRGLGLGYRAKYLVKTVGILKEKGGDNWLIGLRGKRYDEVQTELTQLEGIGLKVADCISLFSLDCKSSIPVDTHVYQIFHKFYESGKQKSLTTANYHKIGNFFRERFGEYAGLSLIHI
eukprot:TRINITY_DN25572_c0_g3_i1.p1 TRINITY_DN25572_c0_g3~~TRINITY_DN25572_c0_g3_i1.p1  ORF type:complete len:273 (-),score=59.59 TRINITY_DN25572_c0_g3_i1:60-878(-)